MNIQLNGQAITMIQQQDLQTLLKAYGLLMPYTAVAINQIIIQPTDYTQTYLKEGDSIEVVTPMQGG